MDPGLVALEVEDVAQVGAAPGVDRLVVVAHDAQVVMRGGERPDDPVLGRVRVLVLVDVEVAPARLVAGEDLGLGLEQAHGLDEEVVEVEGAGGPQALSVAGGDPGDLALEVGGCALRQVLHGLQVVLGPADRLQHGPRPQHAALDREVEVAEDLLHQALLVVRVVDDEARREADRRPVPTQDPGAQGVERAHLDLAAVVRPDEGDDPLAHLAGGLVRERHGEDPPRRDVLHAHQVGDAVGDDARLARPGPGKDEERVLPRS